MLQLVFRKKVLGQKSYLVAWVHEHKFQVAGQLDMDLTEFSCSISCVLWFERRVAEITFGFPFPPHFIWNC